MSSKTKLNKDEISGQINSILEALTQTNAKLAGLEEKHDAQHAEIKDSLLKSDARLESLEKREPDKSPILMDQKSEDLPKIAEGLDSNEYSFITSQENFVEANPMANVKIEKISRDPVLSIMDFEPPSSQIFATTPDFKHIYLKDLEVKKCLKFLKDVKHFALQHGVRIRIPFQIAERNSHLVARANDMTLDQFRVLSNAYCERLLRLQVQPKSAVEFLELMKTVKFSISEDIRTTQVTFEIIYTSYLVYSSAYRELYEFMNNGQDEDLIPPIDIRKKGLVFFFLNGLPKTFSDVFINILNREGFFYSKPAPTFIQFLDRFETVVREKGYKPYVAFKQIEIICKQFTEDSDVLKSNLKTRDNHLLVMNPTPGVVKKDTKLPCYRYFLEKSCP